eukprot:gene2613-3573_t
MDHFYTSNIHEIGTTQVGVVGNNGYRYEGSIGYIFKEPRPGTVCLHRYHNGNDHFYTTSINEIGTTQIGASRNGGYKYEGCARFIYHQAGDRRIQLFRYLNSVGDHFYTTNWNELRHENHGYQYEGIAGYVSDSPEPVDTTQLPVHLIMQGDGNLVLYNSKNHPLWNSGTASATSTSTLEDEKEE